MIEKTGKNLTVVIQGDIINKFNFQQIIDSYRVHLPSCELIISTWNKNKDQKYNGYDRMIFTNDCGELKTTNSQRKTPNNINRQILSSRIGIEASNREYCLKVRSDLAAKSSNFVEIYNKGFSKQCPNNSEIGRFLISNLSSKDPYFLYKAPLHFCDWLVLGKTGSVLELFSLPLLNSKDLSAPTNSIFSEELRGEMWSAETWLWKEYLSRFYKFTMEHEFDCNPRVMEVHDRFVQERVIICDNDRLGFFANKDIYLKIKGLRLVYEYSFFDWLYVSGKYKLFGYRFFYLTFIIYLTKLAKLLVLGLSKIKQKLKTTLDIENASK
jgi:hypothetical protein